MDTPLFILPPAEDDDEKAAHLRWLDRYVSGLRETQAGEDSEPLPDFGVSLAAAVAHKQENITHRAKTPEPSLDQIRDYLEQHGASMPAEQFANVVTLLIAVQNKQNDAAQLTADISGDIGYACDILGIEQPGL